MAWHGYVLLEINPTFADSLTEQRRRDIMTRIKELISDKRLPAFALGVRWTKDKRAVILQGNFDVTSKSEFVKKLAAALGVTQTQVNNNLTMTVFGAGKNVKEGAVAARAYVAGTLERWREVI